MTTQLTNILATVFWASIAVCFAVDAGITFYAKKTQKALPKEVMDVDEIAKFVVAEAATLDISGAQKKIQAVQALLNQAKKQGQPVTEEVAKGAVQNAYNNLDQSTTPDQVGVDDDQAKPIGFVPSSDNKGSDSVA